MSSVHEIYIEISTSLVPLHYSERLTCLSLKCHVHDTFRVLLNKVFK